MIILKKSNAVTLDGFLVAFHVGLFGDLANLLVDIPALWNIDLSKHVGL